MPAVPDLSAHPPVALPRSAVRTVAGEDGAPYRLLLAWPAEPPPPNGHPVIYVLDGGSMFATVVETVRMRSRRADVTGVVPAVVVGIDGAGQGPVERARRTRDYTPGPAMADSGEDGRIEGETGGADRFLAWIEARAKPEVESLLPVDRGRQTLLGHSLAGYFALHALVARPGAFQRYVAASPSLWWDEARVRAGLPALGRWLAEAPRDLRVFLAAGEYEQALAPGEADGPRAEEKAFRRASRRMIDAARELAGEIGALGGSRVEFARFDGADHASSVLRTIDRCLRFVLEP